MSFILGENKYFIDDLDLSDEELLLEYLFRREWWKKENLKFEIPEILEKVNNNKLKIIEKKELDLSLINKKDTIQSINGNLVIGVINEKLKFFVDQYGNIRNRYGYLDEWYEELEIIVREAINQNYSIEQLYQQI